MTDHTHSQYVAGCFRCDLSRDEVGDNNLPEVNVYTVYRWDCPCGNVMESDADFDDVETCDYCGLVVRVL